MQSISLKTLTVSLGLLMGLQGCVTNSASPISGQKTATQKAIGKCVASMVITTGVGALVGAAVGRSGSSAGRGALAGAAVGVGSCAVLIHVAAAEDRKRLEDAERKAVQLNHSSTSKIKTSSGTHVTVQTKVTKAPVPVTRPGNNTPVSEKQETATPQFTACRYAEQKVSVQGKSASSGKQLWCRMETGDWHPINQ
ncbi:hypothetical protein [Flexibacterium corallicola]|uniref:hypothetical protein n=1 Tax=Flexibacterium corallicola TaxID=3037259 RepID=UPI00286FA5F3|nr:hypothetical protein [Pseudovibrio sp. M1P-2-3]